MGLHPHAASILLNPGDFSRQMQLHIRQATHRAQQQAMQVSARNRGVGGTITLHHRRPQGQLAQHAAMRCVAHPQALRECSYGPQSVALPPGLQHPDPIGPELNPRTHLAEFHGLLQELDVNTPLPQRKRCSQSPDTTARNHNVLFHAAIVV